MFRKWMLIGLCFALAGCGSIKKQWVEFAPDRDGAYLDAETAPALKVPPNMAMNKAYISDPYPVPKGTLPSKGAKPVDIFPPDLKKEPSDDDSEDDADAS